VDNLVNLVLLAPGVEEPPRAEVERVLAPRGVLYSCLEKRILWRKPLPEAMDEWTHHMYDASGIGASMDRLVGPPRHLQ